MHRLPIMGGRAFERLPAPEPRLRVEPLAADLTRASIDGTLASGWVGSFAAGLARHGLNVERGAAAKTAGGRWVARFEVRRTETAIDPDRLDWLALLTHPVEPLRTALVLFRYRLMRAPQDLHLELEGQDSVGFLASLLRRLAFLSLFPTELALETRDGCVHDRFRVRAAGHQPPSETAERALRLVLEALVRRQAPGQP